jgi:PAS domain S-box-containing protein
MVPTQFGCLSGPADRSAWGWTALMEALPLGVILGDPAGRLLEANAAAGRILGLDRAALLASGLAGLRARLTAADGTPVTAVDFPGGTASGAQVCRQAFGWTAEGRETVWLEVSAGPLPGGGVLLSFEDIGQRLAAEAALRRSEEKCSKAFHASPDAITINRLGDGDYLDVNEGFTRVTGYTAAEVLGRSSLPGAVGLWQDPGDRQRFQAMLLSQGTIRDQAFPFRRKDGTPYTGLVSGSLIDIQGEPCALCVTRDVTELNRQARQLERMTQLYAALSQVNQAIVWSPGPEALLAKICQVMVLFGKFSTAWIGLDDPATHEVRVASQYGNRTGIPAGFQVRSDESALGRGCVGTAIREGRTCVENDVLGSAALAPWHDLSVQCGFLSMAAIPIRKGGAVCGTLTVYAPEPGFFNQQELGLLEEAAGDIGFALDNHELAVQRKAAEDTVRRMAEELEQRVRERTAQLEASNRELEAFSYSVSHDLRAPLRGIDGFSQALLEDCRDQLDESGRNYLLRIRSGTQRMGLLIDDLLKLSQINRSELNMAEIDLSALCGMVCGELQRSGRERRVEVVIRPGMAARADGRLMMVVLENLLGNAWKFTARCPAPRVEAGETVSAQGERAFFIRDNGAGFDMAYAGKLFQAFQRLHSAAEYEGTGIGLAIVQRIIHRHGGRVWAEAAPGEGAAFFFTIPAPAPE